MLSVVLSWLNVHSIIMQKLFSKDLTVRIDISSIHCLTKNKMFKITKLAVCSWVLHVFFNTDNIYWMEWWAIHQHQFNPQILRLVSYPHAGMMRGWNFTHTDRNHNIHCKPLKCTNNWTQTTGIRKHASNLYTTLCWDIILLW